MRQAVDAVGEGNVRAGQRPVVRGDQVLHRTVELPQKGRRDRPGTRLHEDRLGDHRGPIRIGGMHPRIDGEQRDPLTVDGDLEPLRIRLGVQCPHRRADDGAAHLMVEGNPEHIVAVRGEGVIHGDPAPRAVGCSLDLPPLGGPAGNEVARLGRRRIRIAHRKAADLARRPQVRIHQRRRQQLHIRDVVEVRADGVLRQVFGGIHFHGEQVADGGRVLRPVQPLERTPARVRPRLRRRIQLILQRRRHLHQQLLRRTPRTRRRHHPQPQLRNHLLRQRCARRSVPGVEARQRHVPRLHPVVVAHHAVGAQHPVVRRRRRRGDGRLRRWLPRANRGNRRTGSGAARTQTRRRVAKLRRHREGRQCQNTRQTGGGKEYAHEEQGP